MSKKKIRKRNEDEREYKPNADDYEEEDLKVFKTTDASEIVTTRSRRRPNDSLKTGSPNTSGEQLSPTQSKLENVLSGTVISEKPKVSEVIPQPSVDHSTYTNQTKRGSIIILFGTILILGIIVGYLQLQQNVSADPIIQNMVRATQRSDDPEQQIENIIEITTILLKDRMGRHKCYMEESYLVSTENLKDQLQQFNLTNFNQLWTAAISRILEGKTSIKIFKHYLYTDAGTIPFSCSLREIASKFKFLMFLSLAGVPATLYSIRRSKQRKYDNDILEHVSSEAIKIIETQNTMHSRKEASEPFVVAAEVIELLKRSVSAKRADFWQNVF